MLEQEVLYHLGLPASGHICPGSPTCTPGPGQTKQLKVPAREPRAASCLCAFIHTVPFTWHALHPCSAWLAPLRLEDWPPQRNPPGALWPHQVPDFPGHYSDRSLEVRKKTKSKSIGKIIFVDINITKNYIRSRGVERASQE